MKFLIPNYSCLQNPWLGGYRSEIPVLSVLCPQLNLLNNPHPPPPWTKILGTPLFTKAHHLSAFWIRTIQSMTPSPFSYYPPIHAFFFQIVSFPQNSTPKSRMRLFSPTHVLLATSWFVRPNDIWWEVQISACETLEDSQKASVQHGVSFVSSHCTVPSIRSASSRAGLGFAIYEICYCDLTTATHINTGYRYCAGDAAVSAGLCWEYAGLYIH